MMTQTNKIPLFYTSILYITGLLLFLEWIYPLQSLIGMTNIEVFIGYTIVCFLLSIIPINWQLTSLLKGVFLMGVVYLLHGDELSIQSIIGEISFNTNMLLSQKWYETTEVFQTISFLLFIWLMSYLMHYWFIVMHRVSIFVWMTIVYVGLLDTFTDYHAGPAVIRTFVISMVALAIAHLLKELTKENVQDMPAEKMYRWMAPIALIVSLSTLVGVLTPAYGPQWPDPIPFIKNSAKDANIQKAGLGENDETLGGSFLQDDTVVFKATIEADQKPHYWRALTKDTYTGKGWEASSAENYKLQKPKNIKLSTFEHTKVETTERNASLAFSAQMALNKVVYPYGVREIHGEDISQYDVDTTSGAIQAKVKDQMVRMPAYTVIYDDPAFDISRLQTSTGSDLGSDFEQYIQLPENLPTRITTLAKEITEGYDNHYDQAKAIEQYFGQNGFTYQIDGVPHPKEDEDYVDQFLFETKYGYCDNYSTAMTVMLRTLDIPARWVKGFTAGEWTGETISKADGDYSVYEVTNMNAHSWVEVYFPGSGWVPFEPTQGFDNLSDFVDSRESDEDENKDDTAEELNEPVKRDQAEEKRPEQTEKTADNVQKEQKETKSMLLWYVSGGMFIFFLLSFGMYKARFHIKTFLLRRRLMANTDFIVYEKSYHHLLTVLARHFPEKDPEQTLREYARQMDHHFGSTEMSLLTNHYEQLLYSHGIKEVNHSQWVKLWECLMKRALLK